MNLVQMETLVPMIRENLEGVFEDRPGLPRDVWGNPEVCEGELVLDDLTPFLYRAGPNSKHVIVMDEDGCVIHEYDQGNR